MPVGERSLRAAWNRTARREGIPGGRLRPPAAGQRRQPHAGDRFLRDGRAAQTRAPAGHAEGSQRRMTEQRKRWAAASLVWTMALSACITVNIYFPAPEVRRAAEQIVEETW